jgi:hypothetical protein
MSQRTETIQNVTWEEAELTCGLNDDKPPYLIRSSRNYFAIQVKKKPRNIAIATSYVPESTPEQSLLVAMIDRAIRDLFGSSGLTTQEARTNKRTAKSWFTSNSYEFSETRGISFLFCCEVLELSPSLLKNFLKKKGLL